MQARIFSGSFVAQCLLLLNACGVEESTQFPKTVDQLTREDAPAAQQYLERIWIDFLNALQIPFASGGPKNEELLEQELESYPGVLSDGSVQEFSNRIVRAFVDPGAGGGSPFLETRCASIENVSPVTEFAPYVLNVLSDEETLLDGVNIYKIEYILSPSQELEEENLSGESLGDQIVRSALLTVPANLAERGAVPLVLYGHGGDDGISYREVARVFGELQQEFVIAAPSFPDEPVCERGVNVFTKKCEKTTLATPVGESQPFDSDADEILGLQNCLTRAVFLQESDPQLQKNGIRMPLNAPTASEDQVQTLNQEFAEKLKRYGDVADATVSDPWVARQPISYVVGSSRGGMASLVALAKAGAALTGNPQVEQRQALSHFQCGAFLFPPTTFSMGRFRIALELFLKGMVENTRFAALPTADELDVYFSDYRDGNLQVDEMALRFAQLDALMNSHLAAASLADWSQTPSTPVSERASGRMLLIHGQDDQVVRSEQSRFYGEMMARASQRVRSWWNVPGVQIAVTSFVAPAGKTLADASGLARLFFQHGDQTFYESTQASDAGDLGWDLVNASRAPDFFLQELMNREGEGPEEVFRNWMNSYCPFRESARE